MNNEQTIRGWTRREGESGDEKDGWGRRRAQRVERKTTKSNHSRWPPVLFMREFSDCSTRIAAAESPVIALAESRVMPENIYNTRRLPRIKTRWSFSGDNTRAARTTPTTTTTTTTRTTSPVTAALDKWEKGKNNKRRGRGGKKMGYDRAKIRTGRRFDSSYERWNIVAGCCCCCCCIPIARRAKCNLTILMTRVRSRSNNIRSIF